MSHFLSALVSGFSQPLADLLVAGFTALAAAGVKFLLAHTKNVQVQGVITRLDQAATAAVRQVAQTEVDGLKSASAGGTLTPEQARAASAHALEIVKANLGADGVAQLKKILGVDDVGALIATHNEAAVHKIANEDAPTTVNAPVAVASEGAQPVTKMP